MLDRIPTPLYSTAAVAVSLAGVFLLAGVGSTGPDGAADVPEAPLMEAERGAAASGDGSAEGIKVHGHWTIEVREPDGELVTRREFENALESTAPRTLAELLARVRSVGAWRVQIGTPVGGDPPCSSLSGPTDCFLLETATPVGPHIFNTLSVTSSAGELILSGSAVASRGGQIRHVRTSNLVCDADTSPSDCAVPVSGRLVQAITHADIPPVDVLEGQSVLVTVRISFS